MCIQDDVVKTAVTALFFNGGNMCVLVCESRLCACCHTAAAHVRTVSAHLTLESSSGRLVFSWGDLWHTDCFLIPIVRLLPHRQRDPLANGAASSMKKNESVTKIMTIDPITIGRNEPVSKARHTLEQKGIHHLPVTDGASLVGIITSSDLLRVSYGEFGNQDDRGLDAVLDHTYTLTDLMNQDPTTIDSSQTVRDAALALVSSGFHSLPVVGNGELVGIVTSTDLIQYLIDQY